MKRPIVEEVTLDVKFTVRVPARFVWEEYAPDAGDYFFDGVVDEDDVYHAILEKLNDGDFDYEVDE